MPVRPVKRMGRDGHYRTIGFMWGHKGKLYTIRRWGKKGAHDKAARQGMAVKISQNIRTRHADKWEWFGKGKKKVRCPVCHQLYWRKHTCQYLKPANVTLRRRIGLKTPEKKYYDQSMPFFTSEELSDWEIKQAAQNAGKFGKKKDFIGDKEEPGEIKLVVDDGTVKGWTKTKKYVGGDFVQIHDLIIKPEFRHNSVGTETVKAIFKDPRVEAVGGISLPSARGFWKKLGADILEQDEKPNRFILGRAKFEAAIKEKED